MRQYWQEVDADEKTYENFMEYDEMRLLIFGPQGSGKGTYASRLSPQLGIPHISTGDIFRAEIAAGSELGRKVDGMIKEGKLVPDYTVNEVISKRLQQPDAKKGFIFDGYPRTRAQAEALDKMTKIDGVINLQVPDEILIARISARVQCRTAGHIYNLLTLKPKVAGKCDQDGSELYQRADDTPEAIKKRLATYHEQSAPLLDYYRKKGLVMDFEIREMAIPPETVVAKILQALKGLKR
jgi:adenylate kinase